MQPRSWADWIAHPINTYIETKILHTEAPRAEIPEKWAKVFEELALHAYDRALEKGSSSVQWALRGLKEPIVSCFRDLASHIFFKLSKGEPDGSKFISSILVLANHHLKDLNENSTEDAVRLACIDFTREIFETAFPGKEKDPHLPAILKQMLSGKGIPFSSASTFESLTKVTEKDFTWDYLIEFLAGKMIPLYSKTFKGIATIEAEPGIQKLAEMITKKIINETRGVEKLPFDLTSYHLSDDSIRLLNEVFLQFLSGEEEIVDKAWKWSENTLQKAIRAVLVTLFNSKGGAGPFMTVLGARAVAQIPHWDIKQPNYKRYAKDLLSDQMNLDQFKNLLPDYFPTDDVNSSLYEVIGEYLKELHEHFIKIKGEVQQANDLLKEWEIEEANKLIESVLESLPKTVEEKANIDGFFNHNPFLNQMIAHVMSQPTLEPLRKGTLELICDTFKILLVKEIKKEGGTPQLAFKRIVAGILEKSTVVINEEEDFSFDVMIQSMLNLPSQAQLFEYKQIIRLSDEAKEKLLKLFNFKDQPEENLYNKFVADVVTLRKEGESAIELRQRLFTSWKIKQQAKNILEEVVPVADFNELIPPFARNHGLWDLVSDELFAPNLAIIYHAQKNKAELQVDNLKPLLNKYFPIIKDWLTKQKIESPLIQGFYKEIQGDIGNYFDSQLRPLIESILAFHVNPPESEKKTAELLSKVIEIVWKYRDGKAIDKATTELIDSIVPEALWNRLIPDEASSFIKRDDLRGLLKTFLNEAFEHYKHLENLLGSKEEHKSIRDFVKQTVANLLRPGEEAQQTDETDLTKNTWVLNVRNQLFQTNEASHDKPLNWFAEAFLFAMTDALFLSELEENKENLFANFEEKIGAITKLTHISAKNVLDILVSDEQWDSFFPKEQPEIINILKAIFTKEKAAAFIDPILRDLDTLKSQLQAQEEQVKFRLKPLERFLQEKCIASARESLEKLTPKDDFLSKLITSLATTKNEEVENLRNRVLEQAIYVLAGQLIENPEDATNIVTLIKAFLKGSHAAQKAIETVLPEEMWNTLFTGIFQTAGLREKVIEKTGTFAEEMKTSLKHLEKESKKAEAFLENWPTLKKGAEEAICSLSKIVPEKQPKIIQDLIQGLLADEDIKKQVKQLIDVLLHRTFEKNSVPELLKDVFDLSLQDLFKKLLSEDVRKELLPPFLHGILTQDNLFKWFLEDYVEDMKNTKKDPVIVEKKIHDWFKSKLPEDFKGVAKYVDLLTAQFIELPKTQQILGKDFLFFALNHALKNDDISDFSPEKFLEAFFPDKKANLEGIPEPFKELVYNKAKEELITLVTQVTTKDDRLNLLNKFISENPATDERKTKENLVKYAQKIVSRNYSGFARWFINIIVTLAMHISIKHRLWNMLQDDETFKKLILGFVKAIESHNTEAIDQPTLSETMQSYFREKNILPPLLQGVIANSLGKYLKNSGYTERVSKIDF